MPRRVARVDPSGDAKRRPPSGGRLDVEAAHEHRGTARAAKGAGLLVVMDDDVPHVNGNPQPARQALHSSDRVDAVAAMHPANHVHLSLKAGFLRGWHLAHTRSPPSSYLMASAGFIAR